jgi:hypothetical protein
MPVVMLAERRKVLEIAREMRSRDGIEASRLARDRAGIEARLGDHKSARAWRLIGDAIDDLAAE